MLLTIDVGNTNTVLGVFRGEELIANWRSTPRREKRPAPCLYFPHRWSTTFTAPPPRPRQSRSQSARRPASLAAILPRPIPPSFPRSSHFHSSLARVFHSRSSTPFRTAWSRSPRLPAENDCSRSRIPAATAPALPAATPVFPFPPAAKWQSFRVRRQTSPDSRSVQFPRSQNAPRPVPHASLSKSRPLSSRQSANRSATSHLLPAQSPLEWPHGPRARPSSSKAALARAPAVAAAAASRKFPRPSPIATLVPHALAPRSAPLPGSPRLPARPRAPALAPRGSSS